MSLPTAPSLAAGALQRRLALAAVGLVCAILFPLLATTAVHSAHRLLELPPTWWGTAQLTAAITGVACTAGAAGALWHIASVILALVASRDTAQSTAPDTRPAPGARTARRLLHQWGAPLVRRIAAGAVVAGITAGPALAAPNTSTDDLGWHSTVTATADSEASSHSPADTAPEQEADSAHATPSHRVAAGESLWSITAGELGADASPADIASAWPQLYRANAEAIGTDPGLIYPDTLLTVPEFIDESDA
ncbi:LysM peptidoglycan-binding domain-containing protein [Actinomyces qiguomingii]|uniref:LysM peptidoglycan-binding domain-containing protein n=1 Tax=Actinomyces qiguomingii TaxID=2057800 RepID=UPI000CA03D17|nr:peptidoglycan-binding protein LysM [Actinomyces qiguomingii]